VYTELVTEWFLFLFFVCVFFMKYGNCKSLNPDKDAQILKKLTAYADYQDKFSIIVHLY